jgi:transcriptional regulator with XRE-family HTH domain
MTKKITKPVDAHVGALVRARRIEIGMSQSTLADGIGLTFQQVQKYEKGSNRIGSSRMMQIANVLGVPPTFFFEGAPTAARISAKSQGTMDDLAGFLASKDGTALMKAFVKLPKEVRRSVVNLVDKIARTQ